jgi:hypothetical protein
VIKEKFLTLLGIETVGSRQLSSDSLQALKPQINADLRRFAARDFSPDHIDNIPEFRPIPGEFGKEWGNSRKQRADRYSSRSALIFHNQRGLAKSLVAAHSGFIHKVTELLGCRIAGLRRITQDTKTQEE